MNTSKKSAKIKGVKNSVKSSSKSKFDVQDLETDKESSISDYDENYQQELWEISSNNKSRTKRLFSQVKTNNKNFGKGLISKSDDLSMNSSIKSFQKSLNQSINYGNQSFNFVNMSQSKDSFDLDQEYDSDEEMDEDSSLTFEQKLLKEKWIEIFKKLQKNKIKQEEAFDYPLEEELELALYEWKDSGCILESISKLFSLKVDRLSKETYQLLAQIVRGDIGMKKTEMEDENEETNLEEQDHQDLNNKKKKILKFEEKEITYGSFNEFNPLSAGQSSLEKPEKLVVEKYDIEFDLDPLFRKTSQYFDEASSGGLLINLMNIDKNLLIKLADISDIQAIQNQIQTTNEDEEAKIQSNDQPNKEKRNNENINTKGQKIKKFNYMKDFQTKEFLMKNQELIDGYEIDLFPELVDFKMTVIDEIKLRALNFDDIQNEHIPQENEIKILNRHPRRMEVMDENIQNQISNTLNTAAESENDKNLFNEINQAVETTTFSQQNVMYRTLGDDSMFLNSQSYNRDQESSFLSQNYTPDNSILSKNNKRIRFDTNDQYLESSSDTLYDDNPSTQDSKSIDSQRVSHSILKVGGGDKSLIHNSLLNINWGDPKQWDLQKLTTNQRKKIRQKKVDDMLLGEIKEDMEAEEQNENTNLNGQYKSLTKPIKYFDFSEQNGKEEKYNQVIGKKLKRYKQNLGKKQVEIKQKHCISKDCKMIDEQIFQIGLKNIGIQNKINKNNIREFNGNGYNSMFDTYYNSQQPENNHQENIQKGEYTNEYEYIGFDDLYHNEFEERYYNPQNNNKRDNRIFNKNNENSDRFDINDSPYIRNNLQIPNSAFKYSSQNMYSQLTRTQRFFSQTARKQNVKIRDLKQTVWQCMTQQKSNSLNSQLIPLSQLTAQKQQPKGRKKNNTQQNQVIEDLQIEQAIQQFNSTQDIQSMKFSDLVHSLPDAYGENIDKESVSIQNCFISLLHLANEKQLRLIDPSHTEQEFFIFLEQPLEEEEDSNRIIQSDIFD